MGIEAWPAPAVLSWLLAGALAGGLARGFSGFGAALIFVPLASVALGPRQAVPLMLLIDAVAIATITPGAWKLADRKEVGLLAMGAVLGTPVGAAMLAAADPLALRWGVALMILGLAVLLASGWRFRGQPRPGLTMAVGMVGGVMGGVAMVSGPPAMAYLLGRDAPARELRASFALYLAAGGVLVAIVFAATGLFSAALVPAFLLAGPTYAAGVWGGARLFGLASETAFRRACYAMIFLAALVSLPAWDGLLR